MVVVIPKLNNEGVPNICKPTKLEEHMVYKYRSGNNDGILALKNKEAKWDSALKAYVQNFFGRITMPSIKNFQLINPENGLIFNKF